MKNARKLTALLLSFAVLFLCTFPVAAAEIHGPTYNEMTTFDQIGLMRYTNINTTYLAQGKTWVSADFDTKSNMNLRIDIKVYKSGKLDYSTYTTKSNYDYLGIDVDYDFISGVSYTVEATYTAGSEVVPKSMTFTQR